MNTVFITVVCLATLALEAIWIAYAQAAGYTTSDVTLGVVGVLALPGLLGGFYAIGTTEGAQR